jgi:hypothetical protein
MEELRLLDHEASGTRLKRLRQAFPLPTAYARFAQSISDLQPAMISEEAYELLRRQLNDRLAADPDNWLLRVHETTLNEGIHHHSWFFFNPMSWQNETGFFGDEQIESRRIRKSCCKKGLCRSHPPHNYMVRWRSFDGVDVPYCCAREPPQKRAA